MLHYKSQGKLVQETMAPQALLFAGLGIHPGQDQRLSIDMACNNFLDTPQLIVSPLGDDRSAMQLNGRQWQLGITYKFVR